VVEVDRETLAGLPPSLDHRGSFDQVIADRLLAQHMCPGGEGLERRLVVVARVLEATGGDADQVGPQFGQHRIHIGERRHPELCGSGGCAIR